MFSVVRRLGLFALFAGTLLGCGGGGDTPTPVTEPVTRIEVGQSSVLLTGVNQERQLSARATGSSGATVDARVTWSSSAGDQVSVDTAGKLRSVTPIGSAMIFAEVDGVRSLPVFVSTVELKAGTSLLRDVDIVAVAPPPAPASGGIPGAGTQYDIWLAGQQAPALGAIMLATETISVSGKVVETAVEANRVRVRLERLAMPDLLARYDVNWSIDLTAYDIAIDGPTSGVSGRVQKSGKRRLAAPGSTVPEWKIPKEGVQSPCSASVEARFKAKPLQVKVAGSPKFEVISSKLDAALPPGRLRVALVGDFYIETSVGLTAEAGLTGEAKCEMKGHIPLPFLPVPLNLILKVPVGLGVGASGTVEIASIDIGFSGKNGAKFEIGIDCAPPLPCRGLDSATRINEFTPHMEMASAQTEGLKIELEAGVYFLTGIDAVFGIGNASYQFNMLEVKAGPRQKADFGTAKRQAENLPYASDYDLAFVLEVGPGSAIKDAIKEMIGGEPADLSFSLKVSLPISESPRGTWRPDKTQAVPNRDAVKFAIDITEFSKSYWKLGYNVEKIEIYRRHESEMEFSLMQTISATEPQAHFETTWEPELADAGKHEFAVFAVSKLPVVRLEVGQRQAVQVDCFAAPGKMRALAAGQCVDKWFGTVTGLIKDVSEFTASLTWELDPERNAAPGRPPTALFYRPTGVVRVTLLVWTQLGCTVTPNSFDRFDTSSMLTVFAATSPPSYVFGVSVSSDLRIECPGTPPIVIPGTRVIAFNGSGTLNEAGNIDGSSVTPQGTMTWGFTHGPPPQAAARR